jgi:HEAT repeat protein
MGNAGDPRFVPELERALDAHPSPLVRGHAAWALGQYGAESRVRLERALAEDPGGNVREEARAALAAIEAD